MFLAQFWTIFPILGAKTFFLENLPMSCLTSCAFLAPCQNLEKIMIQLQFQENIWTEGRMDRWTDRPYFIGQFQLPQGSNSTTNN